MRSRRGIGTAAIAAVAAGMLSACTQTPTAPECAVPERPATDPGSAAPLAADGSAREPFGYTTILYEDGWVLTRGDTVEEGFRAVPAMAIPRFDGEVGSWHASYVGACELDAIRGLAADTMSPDVDFGEPQITDSPTTTTTWWSDDGRTDVGVYAFDEWGDDSVSPGQRSARERLRLIRDLMTSGVDADLVVAARALRYSEIFRIDDSRVEIADWPGRDPWEVLDGERCAVVDGEEAAAVYAHLAEGGEVDDRVTITAAPIGADACG